MTRMRNKQLAVGNLLLKYSLPRKVFLVLRSTNFIVKW